MSQFNAVKSQSKSFMFKRVFDNFNINTSFHSSDCEKDPKNPLNDINNENLNLKDAIRKIVGWKVFNYGLSYSIVDSLCRILQPQLMGEMISSSLENKSVFFNAAAIVLCSMVSAFAFYFFSLSVSNIGKRISIASCSMLYRKVLQLKHSATHDTLKGELMNFMTGVSSKLQRSIATSHEKYRVPLEAVAIGILVYREMGSCGVLGIMSLMIFVPVLFWAQKSFLVQVGKLATQSRKRAVLMAEIIEKIKSVKMLCLEQPLAKRIKEIRNREIKRIGGSFFYSAATYFLSFLVKVSIFVCLVSFSNAGNRFNARNVYVVISYYNLMGYSVLKCWPRSVADAQEAKALIEKLQEFLQSKDNIFTKFHFDDKISCHEDVNVTDKFTETMKLLEERKNEQHSSNPGIFMRNVRLTMRSRNTFDLRCDYLELTERKTYGVEGFSNSAEDVLLQIILGEIEVDSGEIEINGKISYASQNLCVIPGTVRENVLCGEAFDDERYKTIIGICKLAKDLEVMAAGDGSFIDESMKNTSFKAKINIARCLYRHADIYVFDDPFREISFDTAKFIFDNAMKKLLKHKMCIVATKHRKLLHEIDDVISMKNGTICNETRTKSSKLEEKFNFMNLSGIKSQYKNKLHHDANVAAPNDNQQTIPSEKDAININSQHNSRPDDKSHRNVYKLLVESINNKTTLLCIGFLFMSAQFTSSAIDLFLLKWVNRDESNRHIAMIQMPALNDTFDENPSVEHNYGDWINYASFYFIALCLLFYFNIHRSFLFFKTCIRASDSIHDNIFCGITRASLKFFDCTSTERIMKLFTTTIAVVDFELPPLFHDFFVVLLEVLAIFAVIIIIVNYWLVLLTLLILAFIVGLHYHSGKLSRSLERAESITRNSIYSHIAATSHGLSTIHSTRSEELFLNEFHQRLYPYTSAMNLLNVAAMKVTFWLEIVCCFYILVIAASFSCFKAINCADIGLAITHALQLIVCCREGVRQMTRLKNRINPAGRVFDYRHVTLEAPLCTLNKFRPTKDWPQNAEIIFTNFYMNFAPGNIYSLKDLNFKINPGEKVGFMGGGKNLIVPALLRFAFNEGSIEIDDIHIETLGLHDLRRVFSLIPPDPILFSGTLRSNLDPFDEKTDEEIWETLEHVEMKNSVSTMQNGLNTNTEFCALSAVERQLLYLARALLGKIKILIFEESSELVGDSEQKNSDDLIKEVIRKKFANNTIIRIACRLDHVMDCDKIIVLECGRIVEIGHPYELIQTSRGYFRSFLDESGFVSAMNLIKISERNYFRNRKPTN